MDLLIGVTLFYLVITAFMYFYQRNLQYFPGGPRPELQVSVDPEVIHVTPEEGISLQGFYWPAKEGFPTVVFFHGNGQGYQYWADKLVALHEQGFGAFFTDYRGYGGQPGRPTEQGIYKDARSFLKALNTKKSVAFSDMVFYGESLGTGVAVQMATEFPPKALVLESAYSSAADIAKARYWMFPVDLLMQDQYRSIDKIDNLRMPKLFIHAVSDRVINIKFARRLYEVTPEPKQFIEIANGGHNDLFDHGLALHISSFLSKITAE